MPAESSSQQRYFGMVHAIQKGELNPNKVSKKMRDTAKEISPEDAKDFAETKHKGLPEHVKKAFYLGFVKEAMKAGLTQAQADQLYKEQDYASKV